MRMKNNLEDLRHIRARLNNLGEDLKHDITDEYDNINVQDILEDIDENLDWLMEKVSEYVDT